MWNGLVQTEKRKNEHDDDDQESQRSLERAREFGAAGEDPAAERLKREALGRFLQGAREKLAADITRRLANGCDIAASLSVGTKTRGSRLPLKCLLGD